MSVGVLGDVWGWAVEPEDMALSVATPGSRSGRGWAAMLMALTLYRHSHSHISTYILAPTLLLPFPARRARPFRAQYMPSVCSSLDSPALTESHLLLSFPSCDPQRYLQNPRCTPDSVIFNLTLFTIRLTRSPWPSRGSAVSHAS